MKLPNTSNAVVDIAKLRDYCLNPKHPYGEHKARVFAAALGIDASTAEWLRLQILAAALRESATLTFEDADGTRYVLDFRVQFGDRQARVRAAWIVRAGEDFPRLTSCYVLS